MGPMERTLRGGRGLSFFIAKLSENRFTTPVKRSIVRSVAASRGTRAILNQYYNILGDQAKSRFHGRYAKVFREQSGPHLAPGEWIVYFGNRTIWLPLRPLWSWLDWDSAISIVGHDIEVKQTYSELVASQDRPELFIDIGANYGTHSILFMSAGIPTISFEPNQKCFSYFEAVCALNGFKGRWERVAIGDKVGHVELVYPQNETSLGSIAPDVVSNMKEAGELTTQKVLVRKLDDYLPEIAHKNILIKIDVEGFEREVILGGVRLIERYKPKIIFESIEAKTRWSFGQLLFDCGYSVNSLPWRPYAPAIPLGMEEFVASSASNFIAVAR
jgi:FkbM family methyltransferase